MANTLNINGTIHDFRGIATSNIDKMVFLTPTTGSSKALFTQANFGVSKIFDDVAITGSGALNEVNVEFTTSSNFSAADWTFTSWGKNDVVVITGSAGGDTITGSDRDDIMVGAFGLANGVDHFDGGAGDDTIRIKSADLDAGTTIEGGTQDAGGGFDQITVEHLDASLSIDLRNATISGVERLTLLDAAEVIVGDDQIGTGGFTELKAGDGVTVTLRVVGDDVDLSGVSSFINWGGQVISIEGTSTSSNKMVGSSEEDLIEGLGNSLDTMTGGAGRDTLIGGNGGDNFRYFAGSEMVAGEDVQGGNGSDTFSLFNTGTIDFSIATISGVETLDYVSGNSSVTFDSNQLGATRITTLSGSAGHDDLIVKAVTTTLDISGLIFNTWTDSNDTITLLGTGSDDTLTGSSHADTLDGRAGNDQLRGGDGDDTYMVNGADTIVEASGEGTDLVKSAATFTLDAAQEIENLTLTGFSAADGTGNDLGNHITGNDAANAIKGLGGNDSLDGGDGNDTFDGGAGSDTMDGGDGFDIVDYSARFEAITVDFSFFGKIVKVNGVFEDGVVNFEGAIGGASGDTFIGDGFANSFVGGGGDDSFVGDFGADTIDGGAGVDFADYGITVLDTEVTLHGTAAGTVKINGDSDDTIIDVENIRTGKGDDRLIGDDNANSFTSGGGDDFLKGGKGLDTLDGGAGNDTADYSDKAKKVKVVLKADALATAEVNGAFEDSLNGIENLIGGSAGDKLTGDGNANSFKGRAGKDVINGGAGSDLADYSDKNKQVDVTLKGSSKTTVKVNGVDEDTLKNIEAVTGGSKADRLTGDSKDNSFKGMGGKDTIDGADGIDTADFSDKTKKVAVTLKGATAATVKLGSANDDSIRNIENVIGGSVGDKLTGDGKANIFKGLGGVDTINGGGGSDTADFSDKTDAVEVALNGSTAVSVLVDGIAEDSLKNVENVIGGSAADTLTGDGKDNTFKGLGGVDHIDGGDGSDTLDLSDKAAPMIVGLNGATEVIVTLSGVITEDFIRNIENVIAGSGSDHVKGDAFANRLTGNDGIDSLQGGDNDDTLIGGAGSDRLSGRDDADTFVFDTALSSTTNVDTITDFAHAIDVIQLDDAIFKNIGASLDAGEFRSGAGIVAAADASDRIIFNTASGDLFFDSDGDKAGGKEAVLFANVGHVPLDAADFRIV